MTRISRQAATSCIILGVLFALLALPSPARADIPSQLKTYTVWNQFDATVRTFERLGLIMSDGRYQGLFFAMVVLGFLLGGIWATTRGMLMGHHTGWAWINWFGMIIMGVIVYLAFIRPTTQITVYDEVLNETKTVGGIPDGVAFVAGLSNTIERGFIDMIWTSGDPRSFRDDAGGVAFNILDKAFRGGVDLAGGDADGQYINISIRRYIEDCLFFEVTRPGTTLDLNAFSTTTDFMPLFATAANPAIYTVWYDHLNKGGATATCQQAWTNLNNYLNNMTDSAANVTKFWTERCSEAGLGPNSEAGSTTDLVQVCRQKASAMVQAILGGSSYSTAHLMRQYLLAWELWNIYTTYNPDEAVAALSSRAAGNSMIGMGIMANEWIPVIRSVVFSIFVGMIPFLCILIPTPLFTRAISFLFGIFLFLTSWGICDALVHSFAMDKTLDLFREIANGNLGLKSMMLFSPMSEKTLALFGAARWSAIMVAGVFSSLIARFGGSALAHFAGGLAAYKSFGAGAAETVMNPERWSQAVKRTSEVIPTITYANAGWASVSAAGAYQASSRLGTSVGTVNDIGGGNPFAAGAAVAGANVTGIKERIAHSGAVKEYAMSHGMTENQVISAVQRYQTASHAGSARALNNLARDLNTNVYEAMDFLKDTGLRESYGRAVGLRKAYDRAVSDPSIGFKGGFDDYVAMQAELQSEKGFSEAQAVDKYAALYGGGKMGLLKDQAEFRLGQVEGMLSKLRGMRLNPGNIGQVLGQLQGVRSFIDSKVYSQVGDRGVELTRAGEQFNEFRKMLYRQAMDDIATTGNIQPDTLGAIRKMKETDIARAQLRAAGDVEQVIGSESAHGWGTYLRKHGVNVTDSDLVNSTAQMSFVPGKDGSLIPVMVVSKKGQKIAEFDMREADYRDVQRGQKPGDGLHKFGGVTLEAVTERTDHGKILEVKGYDRSGNMRHLFVSKTTGKVIEDHVSKGPDFSRANVISMVRSSSVPEEVFKNPGYAIAFANRFASEWGKEYTGSISRDEVTQMANDLRGRFGFGGGAGEKGLFGFSFGVSGKRLDYTTAKTTSKRDVIYGITKDILTRQEWTDQQKMEHLERLNTELLKGDFFNPDRLPNKKDMMDAGGLDREQTPFSGKYETKEERERHLKNFGTKFDQPIFIRPDHPTRDDET